MSVELLGGLFVGALVSGVVPLVNAELLVVAAAGAAASVAALPATLAVATVSAAGQMTSKTVLFGLARWAPSRLPARARRVVDRASGRAERRPAALWAAILASAATGLPPFYGVSLAAGALGVRTSTFVSSGLLGRLARFGVLALGAHVAASRLLEGGGAWTGTLGAVARLAGVGG